MTQQVRLNFLNWNPDSEALGNEGLVLAENVYHDTEGYKEIRVPTSGAFSTTGSLTATVLAVQARRVGGAGQTWCCWIKTSPTAGSQMHFGFDGATASHTVTTGATAFSTLVSSASILSFDTTEFDGGIFFCARAEGARSDTGSTISLAFTGFQPNVT